ncbi:uncharacterized protein LAJ45_10151 [Morchella importuna]|uniref:uncharacterized protein n=1 Tax=Morchella importuna TaxID=1174673 RepID=UPI001E8CBC3F|nr:uncharacterized protein LAJ45_10151 [Morchella importuna]KAH8145827.1 hypothetical protein LAJ45_10151 [Morchella importuna]
MVGAGSARGAWWLILPVIETTEPYSSRELRLNSYNTIYLLGGGTSTRTQSSYTNHHYHHPSPMTPP